VPLIQIPFYYVFLYLCLSLRPPTRGQHSLYRILKIDCERVVCRPTRSQILEHWVWHLYIALRFGSPMKRHHEITMAIPENTVEGVNFSFASPGSSPSLIYCRVLPYRPAMYSYLSRSSSITYLSLRSPMSVHIFLLYVCIIFHRYIMNML
jgi:hypothetical protein